MPAAPPRRAFLHLAALLLVLSCDDGTGPGLGPCDRPQACVVAGPDLVVEAPRILWPAATPTDPVTGDPVVQPGIPLAIRIEVLNRGDTASDPARLTVWLPGGAAQWTELTVPHLEPGAAFVDTVGLAASTDLGFTDDAVAVHAWLDPATLADDPLHGNDRASSANFHVALPVLLATIRLARDTVQLGSAIRFDIEIANRSRHAAQPASRVAFCFFDYDVGCGLGEIGAPFALLDVPALPPGASWSGAFDGPLPPDASEPFREWEWSMVACIGPADAKLADFRAGDAGSSTRCLREPVRILVRPNPPASCPVSVIVPDTVVTDAHATDCVAAGDSYDVYAFDAVAGETYERNGAVDALRGDGTEVAFAWAGTDAHGVGWYRYTAERNERVFLVVRSHRDYALTLRRLP